MSDFIPDNQRVFPLLNQSDRDEAAAALYAYCDELTTVMERQDFVNKLAEKLALPWQDILNKGMFKLVTPDECVALMNEQVDIQLHTHRHFLPETSRDEMAAEIEENRVSIEKICGIKATHLCYPSGYYTADHLNWLEGCEVDSATTCEPGLNDAKTPVLRLLRFLDGEHIHQLEFEAEVSGFKHLLQRAFSFK